MSKCHIVGNHMSRLILNFCLSKCSYNTFQKANNKDTDLTADAQAGIGLYFDALCPSQQFFSNVGTV